MSKRPHLRLTWLASPGSGQMWKIRPVKNDPNFWFPLGISFVPTSARLSGIPLPGARPNSTKTKSQIFDENPLKWKNTLLGLFSEISSKFVF